VKRWLRLAAGLLCAAAGLLPLPAAFAQAPAACPPVAHLPGAEELQAVAKTARDRGLLWRLVKGGRSSYLFGTIHVGRLDWLVPGPKVAAALRDAQTVALEIDPTDPALQQEMAAAGAAHAAGEAAAALAPPLQRRLAAQIAAACLPPAQLAQQHPVMQVVTLTVLAARREGLDPAYAQEFMLAGYARAAQKPIVSLETAALQIDSLMPDSAEEAEHQVEAMLDQLESPAAAQILQHLSRAWENGRLDELEDYESWCQCAQSDEDRAFLRRIIDDRNPHLAERIAAEHDQGRRVFAAVGALHMTGPLALPALLARAGFVVQRIPF
jgi:uncharacterized protein YbaP (TraB family)